ncbi:MAG: hypothetical protein KJO69_08390, partial [Gammaproteobacteria bacterium]|nr:hypothetical protein [Gammaproteobacteria bacterium]
LDNLGCELAENRTWCDVQPLGGGLRGFVAAEYLLPAVSPNGMVVFGTDQSAIRASLGVFDATGKISCNVSNLSDTFCRFYVARDSGGYATLRIETATGLSNVFFFRMGIAIGGSSSEADKPGSFRSERQSDASLIYLGNDSFLVPDTIILGG